MRAVTAWFVLLALVPGRPVAAPQLPAAVQATLRSMYADMGQVRYAATSVDLNGDGRDEVLVHVMGASVCGSGGCNTHVFTPRGGDSYQSVANVTISNPPIRVSSRSAHGWKNLIVRVYNGSAAPRDAELEHDGERYPSNPTVPPAHPPARAKGAHVLIPESASFENADVLVW